MRSKRSGYGVEMIVATPGNRKNNTQKRRSEN